METQIMLKIIMHINYSNQKKIKFLILFRNIYVTTTIPISIISLHISDTEANLDVCKFLNYFMLMI